MCVGEVSFEDIGGEKKNRRGSNKCHCSRLKICLIYFPVKYRILTFSGEHRSCSGKAAFSSATQLLKSAIVRVCTYGCSSSISLLFLTLPRSKKFEKNESALCTTDSSWLSCDSGLLVRVSGLFSSFDALKRSRGMSNKIGVLRQVW